MENISLSGSGMAGVIELIGGHFLALMDRPKPKRNPDNDTIKIMVCRDYFDDGFEVEVEILSYTPEHQGGCWDERLSESVELGNAFTTEGAFIELTKLELRQAEEYALDQIHRNSKAGGQASRGNPNPTRTNRNSTTGR